MPRPTSEQKKKKEKSARDRRRRQEEEEERVRRRQQGEGGDEGGLGEPVGGAGGAELSQGTATQTVPAPLGPTVQGTGAEGRVGDPIQSGSAIAPGPVVKSGRGRPKKIPVVDALIPAAPTTGVALIPAAPGDGVALISAAPGLGEALIPAAPLEVETLIPAAPSDGDAPVRVAPMADAQAFRQVAELGEDRYMLATVIAFEANLNATNLAALTRSLAHGWGVAGVEHCLHASELDAYLMAVIALRRTPAAMVTTAFGFTEHYRAMQHPDVRAAEDRDRPHRAAAFVHGNVAGADVVLIPRLNYHAPAGLLNTSDTTGHFTIGVYYPQTGVVHHYDPLQMPADDNMRQYYRRVVGTLHNEGDQPYRFLRD